MSLGGSYGYRNQGGSKELKPSVTVPRMDPGTITSRVYTQACQGGGEGAQLRKEWPRPSPAPPPLCITLKPFRVKANSMEAGTGQGLAKYCYWLGNEEG